MPASDIVSSGVTLDAQWWIRAAQSAVRRFCGWHVAPSVSEVLRVDSYGGRVLHLPSKHVTAIESVSVDGEDLAGQFDWSEAGTVVLRSGSWPDRPGAVQVSLTHGWDVDEAPEVAALILAVGKRARTQPGVIASQSVNGASVAYQTAGGAPLSVPLLEIEKSMLATYRLNWGLA